MAKKVDFNPVREQLMDIVAAELANDSEVLQVASQELAIPVIDAEGNEGYVVITFRVPKGSRDGEPYDGHEMAEDYRFKQEQKAKAKAEREAKKAKAKAEKEKGKKGE